MVVTHSSRLQKKMILQKCLKLFTLFLDSMYFKTVKLFFFCMNARGQSFMQTGTGTFDNLTGKTLDCMTDSQIPSSNTGKLLLEG